MNAKKVYDYFRIYKKYLEMHNLDDDSKFITVKDLLYFVDTIINGEDSKEIIKTLAHEKL